LMETAADLGKKYRGLTTIHLSTYVMFPNYVNVIVYNSFYEIGIKILADSIIHTVLGF